MPSLNVLSLFDGMSCGRIALKRAGIPVGRYLASEIEPNAIKVSRANWPDTEQIGDVCAVRGEDLPNIDLLIGGSPCQGFSVAGSRLAFDDPRSKLFFEYERLLRETNPRWFFLENVAMKKEHVGIITERLGVEPVAIDSGLVSAQRRKRLYWTNIPFQGLPADKGLAVCDILEGEVDGRYRVSRTKVLTVLPEGRAMFGHFGGNSQTDRVYRTDGKSVTLCASPGGAKTGMYLIGNARRAIVQSAPENANRGPFKRYLAEYPDGRREWIAANIRTLTPVECERLQTVPDGYSSGVSDAARIKMLGNGWTVDVVAWFFGFLANELRAYKAA